MALHSTISSSTISSMICGTGIHDKLRAPVVHNNGHVQLVRELQLRNTTARLDHLQACTTGTSATLSKNCTTTGVSTTLSKNWTNPSDDLHNRVIDHLHKLQLRDSNGHVSNLVQELHGLPRTATASNPKQRARRQPCPRTARRHPPPPLTPAPSGNPLWGSRAPP